MEEIMIYLSVKALKIFAECLSTSKKKVMFLWPEIPLHVELHKGSMPKLTLCIFFY